MIVTDIIGVLFSLSGHDKSCHLLITYLSLVVFTFTYQAPEALMVLLTEFWENNKGLEYPERKYMYCNCSH